MRSPSIWMTIKGSKQGQFKGDVTKDAKGVKKDSMGIYSVDYGIDIPRDATSGLPTGKRQHHPVTIVKQVGPSTINLLTAATTNESLSTVILTFVKPDTSGEFKVYLQIELTNATISSYSLTSSEETETSGGSTERSQGQIAGAGVASHTTEARLERVSLVFQKIEVTWSDGGLTYSDDWKDFMG